MVISLYKIPMKVDNQNGLLGSVLSNFPQLTDTPSPKPSSNLFEVFKTFLLHVGLLLKKNFTLQKRSLRTTLVQYWAPLIGCYIILVLQGLQDNIVAGTLIETPISTIGKIPKCFGTETHPDDCISIAYATVVSIFSMCRLYI